MLPPFINVRYFSLILTINILKCVSIYTNQERSYIHEQRGYFSKFTIVATLCGLHMKVVVWLKFFYRFFFTTELYLKWTDLQIFGLGFAWH